MIGIGAGELSAESAAFPTARFSVVDELTCCYDRPAEPANVHLEAWLPGGIELEALRASVRAVLDARPRARIRRARAGRWQLGSNWECPPAPDMDPVLTTRWLTDADLTGQRAAFLSASPPLDISPPLRLLLAAGASRDCLILNAHHAALDGLSSLSLLRAVAARYSEELGYGPDHDSPYHDRLYHDRPDHDRPVTGDHGSGIRAPSGPITRIARRPDLAESAPRSGYGACLVTWGGLGAAAGRLRAVGSSVNDLLIAAMMITVRQWNDANGGRTGRIAITMPVGDRTADGADGADGAWGHLSRLTAVTATVPSGSQASDLIGLVTRQTRDAKEHPGPQVDLPSRMLASMPVPVAIRRRLLQAGLRVAGPWFCDTSLVSNLGVIRPLRFGPAVASGVWFSTSAHLPRGLSLGVITSAGQLRLTFRYQRGLLGDAAAGDFAQRYLTVLDDFAGPEAGQ